MIKNKENSVREQLEKLIRSQSLKAVLQDATGGIRLSFSTPPDIAAGDVLLVAGRRTGGFAVEEFEKTGTAPLLAQEATLTEGRSDVRIICLFSS